MGKTERELGVALAVDSDGALTIIRQPKSKIEPFEKVNAAMTVALALANDMTLTEYRLLLYVLGTMDTYNVCWDSCTRIAERLKVSQPTFSSAVCSLVERGFLTRCGWSGRAYHLMLSPEIATRCREEAIGNVVKLWNDAITEAVERCGQPSVGVVEVKNAKARGEGLQARQKARQERVAPRSKAKPPKGATGGAEGAMVTA